MQLNTKTSQLELQYRGVHTSKGAVYIHVSPDS